MESNKHEDSIRLTTPHFDVTVRGQAVTIVEYFDMWKGAMAAAGFAMEDFILDVRED